MAESKAKTPFDPDQLLLEARSELARAEELAESDPEAALAAFDVILLNDGTNILCHLCLKSPLFEKKNGTNAFVSH